MYARENCGERIGGPWSRKGINKNRVQCFPSQGDAVGKNEQGEVLEPIGTVGEELRRASWAAGLGLGKES